MFLRLCLLPFQAERDRPIFDDALRRRAGGAGVVPLASSSAILGDALFASVALLATARRQGRSRASGALHRIYSETSIPNSSTDGDCPLAL